VTRAVFFDVDFTLSLAHDIDGARRSGMRGIFVARSGRAAGDCPAGVPVIASVRELSPPR
jgi:FMN phosphatase YigB (HAD superfamily)